jgi:iron complex transport system ATP-binding protein
MNVTARDVNVVLDGAAILERCAIDACDGELVGLIGPNGSGKSTLLRAVSRAVRPATGDVRMDGEDVWRLGAREVARRAAVVTQERSSDFDFSVLEVVHMGRSPHKGRLERDTADDDDVVLAALERVGMLAAAARLFATLSGGEKQKVLVARALAQRPRVLVLDEPTNHLDIRAQLELLNLVRGLGLTTIAALHDLNHAAFYCDRVYVLAGGLVVAAGPVEEVLQPPLLAEVFGVHAHLLPHPTTGRPHFVFEPLTHDHRQPKGHAP